MMSPMTLQVGGHHAHHGAHPYREAYLFGAKWRGHSMAKAPFAHPWIVCNLKNTISFFVHLHSAHTRPLGSDSDHSTNSSTIFGTHSGLRVLNSTGLSVLAAKTKAEALLQLEPHLQELGGAAMGRRHGGAWLSTTTARLLLPVHTAACLVLLAQQRSPLKYNSKPGAFFVRAGLPALTSRGVADHVGRGESRGSDPESRTAPSALFHHQGEPAGPQGLRRGPWGSPQPACRSPCRSPDAPWPASRRPTRLPACAGGPHCGWTSGAEGSVQLGAAAGAGRWLLARGAGALDGGLAAGDRWESHARRRAAKCPDWLPALCLPPPRPRSLLPLHNPLPLCEWLVCPFLPLPMLQQPLCSAGRLWWAVLCSGCMPTLRAWWPRRLVGTPLLPLYFCLPLSWLPCLPALACFVELILCLFSWCAEERDLWGQRLAAVGQAAASAAAQGSMSQAWPILQRELHLQHLPFYPTSWYHLTPDPHHPALTSPFLLLCPLPE